MLGKYSKGEFRDIEPTEFKVYEYLLKLKSFTTNDYVLIKSKMDFCDDEVGITLPTLRKVLKGLKDKGYIDYTASKSHSIKIRV